MAYCKAQLWSTVNSMTIFFLNTHSQPFYFLPIPNRQTLRHDKTKLMQHKYQRRENKKYILLGLVPLNPIVWCYVWHYVWLNVVINKVILLLSKIMVTWIFEHYHIVHEIHSMWFMWFNHRRYKSQVLCKLKILVCSRWWNWAFHLRKL